MLLNITRWFGVAVESSVAWPDRQTTVEFERRTLTLTPFDERHSATVEVDLDEHLNEANAHALIRRFLSALAWRDGFFIRELFQGGGARGNNVRLGHDLPSRVKTAHFQPHVPSASGDPNAILALALYREAMGVSSNAYQVLGFFKIINIRYSTGGAQKAWIRATLPALAKTRGASRLKELQAEGDDVAAYLYESCRCAVAHANAEPIANPDDVVDDDRLKADLPLIRALAEHLMQVELGLAR